MITDFEKQMAVAMQKSKQQSKVPLDVKKQNTIKKIVFLKEKLKEGIKIKDKLITNKNYEDLIKLRGKLCALQILEEKKKWGKIDKEDREDLIAEYAKDCVKLRNMVNSII